MDKILFVKKKSGFHQMEAITFHPVAKNTMEAWSLTAIIFSTISPLTFTFMNMVEFCILQSCNDDSSKILGEGR